MIPLGTLDVKAASNQHVIVLPNSNGNDSTSVSIASINDANAYQPLTLLGSRFNFMNGNVGIGITTPNKLLHIKTTTGNNAELDIQSGTKPWWGIYHDEATEQLRFWNGSDRIVFASGGNVGIGTTGPSTKLQVLASGTDNTAGDSITSAAITSVGPSVVFNTAGNPANLQVMSNSALGADIGGTIGIGGRYTGTQFAQFGIIKAAKENSTDGNYATYMAFGTRSNGTNITEKMRIDSSGNVGIGTNNP